MTLGDRTITVTIDGGGRVAHSNGDTGRAISGFVCRREYVEDPEMGTLKRAFSLSSDLWHPRLDEPNVWFYYQVGNSWQTRMEKANDDPSTSR